MSKLHPLKKARLSAAYISEHDGRSNLTLVLSGPESALASARRMIKNTRADVFLERNAINNTLKITTALNNAHPMDSAISFAIYMYRLTDCRLGGVFMQSDCDQFGAGENAAYAPAISVTVAPPAADDKLNLLGMLSMGIINTNLDPKLGYAPDPRGDGLRLICLDRTFDTETDALMSAEQSVKHLEKHYGIFRTQPKGLELTNLRTMIKPHSAHPDRDLNIAIARLEGESRSLDDAMRAMRHRYRDRIAEMGRGETHIDIGCLEGDEPDPTGILAALHMTTGCRLPIELKPAILPGDEQTDSFKPAIETHIQGEAGLSKPTLRFAAARYAGAYIPEKHSVPDSIDPHGPSRVVLERARSNELEAMHSATEMANRISQRFNGVQAQGTDHHR